VKSKGLQRLRWFCQMCQKQCRDENGFKNHCTTDGHLRQMEKFSSDSNNYIERFSRDFEKSYLDVLSHHHHTNRVNANYVYNELIQDKGHIHMNSTRWESLASFVRYLGETGKCAVDETESGWFVRWIDLEEKRRDIVARNRAVHEARELEIHDKTLLKRMKEMSTGSEAVPEDILDEQSEYLEEKPIVIAHSKTHKLSAPPAVFSSSKQNETVKMEPEPTTSSDDTKTWLMPEIVVKIVSSKVGPDTKNQKAVVVDVRGDEADLVLLKTGTEISSVPSKRLESVIPNIGGKVMVLGLHLMKGMVGTLAELDKKESRAIIRFSDGTTHRFEFEDISKVFEEKDD